jgi:hypothetical protein
MLSLDKRSSFKMGWLLVMFDLPVLSKKQRKAASGFRNECKRLILARLKNRAADCWCVRLVDAKHFSRRGQARGVAARV